VRELITNRLKSNLVNILGWQTNRKIIVFESDDWGMIRMSSKDAYQKLKKNGYPVHKSIYNQFDSLEQNEDLLMLMDVLSSVKDKNGNYAKFTINNIVTNPDFQKIKENSFEKYYYETFTDTLKKNKNSDEVFNLYKQGIDSGIFQVQFHGREHVHVNNWLTKLQNKDKMFLDAFCQDMYTINDERGNSCRYECLDAMAAYSSYDFEDIKKSVEDGLIIFQNLWGFRSYSLIAPCYTWNSEMESHFKDNGVEVIQGARAQRQPLFEAHNFQIKRHYMGKKNPQNMLYLIRNVNFEQSENKKIDIVSSAMKEIEIAFSWKKPAIISTHRVNYIGSLCEKNRKNNLNLLKDLLNSISKRYPNVEFMSTDELAKIIYKA
jgi:hypothetical protein